MEKLTIVNIFIKPPHVSYRNHFHTIAVGDAVSAFTVDKTTQLHASSSKREPVSDREVIQGRLLSHTLSAGSLQRWC